MDKPRDHPRHRRIELEKEQKAADQRKPDSAEVSRPLV
jgi:hypothetical protein